MVRHASGACIATPEWVSWATQTGRFDLVSLLISVVGLSLVAAGIFAFGYFRGEAYTMAKKTAEDITEERLTKLLRQIETRMEDFDKAAQKAKQPTATPSTAGALKATEAGEFEDGEGK